MDELPPLPDLPNAQRWTTALVLEYARSYAEQAVKQERESMKELSRLAEIALRESKGCPIVQDWQSCALKVCAAIRARSSMESK